jgi:hypothetical protein
MRSVWVSKREDFLIVRNLLAVENAAASLVGHLLPRAAIICDLVANGVDLHGVSDGLAAQILGRIKRSFGVRHHLFSDFRSGRGSSPSDVQRAGDLSCVEARTCAVSLRAGDCGTP